ncbi:MAG: phage baseplate assembly protein V [Pseudomonadota bacterium]
MVGEFLDSQSQPTQSGSEKSGFMSGKVIRNCGPMGRVLVRLAAQDKEVWARVIAPDTGVYFIPQVNEEVLIGFQQGDITEAFVMGRLWNDKSQPPKQEPGDPVTQRVIQTPAGHDITFDDKALSLVIKTKDGQQISLNPNGIELTSDSKKGAMITLDKNGNITIHATQKISFEAASIELNATTINIGGITSNINIGC